MDIITVFIMIQRSYKTKSQLLNNPQLCDYVMRKGSHWPYAMNNILPVIKTEARVHWEEAVRAPAPLNYL